MELLFHPKQMSYRSFQRITVPKICFLCYDLGGKDSNAILASFCSSYTAAMLVLYSIIFQSNFTFNFFQT